MQQQQQQQQQPQPQTQYHHSNSMSLMFVTTSKVTSPLSPHCLCRLGRLCPRRRRLWDRLGTSLGRNLGRCLGRRSCRRRLRLGCGFAVVPVLLASRRRWKVPRISKVFLLGIRWDKWWLDHLGSIPLQLVHIGPAGLTHPDCLKRGTSLWHHQWRIIQDCSHEGLAPPCLVSPAPLKEGPWFPARSTDQHIASEALERSWSRVSGWHLDVWRGKTRRTMEMSLLQTAL